MIREIRIGTIDALFRMVAEQDYRADLDRYRNLYIYRGEPDASFVLSTSLSRNCKELSAQLEPAMLRNFRKYAVLEEPMIDRSVWQQMILGQHHGLPTRLLDWSYSPLMATHFAVTENDLEEMDQHDAVVWRTDIHELHAMLPEAYREIIRKYRTTVFSVDMLTEICDSVEQYDRDMAGKAMIIIEPPSLDPRIVNQYSFFSIIPQGMNDIEGFLDANTEHTVRYIIEKEIRWQVRDMLDHQNITERIAYPGLDGLSRWLGRHYFVKGSQPSGLPEHHHAENAYDDPMVGKSG